MSIKIKTLSKHPVCKEDFACNPSTYPCECDIDCKIDEYLKSSTCEKSIIDDLVIMCEEIIDTPNTVPINSLDKKAANKINL